MPMTRPVAENVARALRQAMDAGRWSPSRRVEDMLLDLERCLCVRIQSGQPELDAMNRRLIDHPASALLAVATRCMTDGGFGEPTPSEIALFGRPPSPRLVVASDLPLLEGLSLAA